MISFHIDYMLSGAFTGICVGLTGVGGGALMTPILLLLGVPPSTAIATDLWFAAATKIVGAKIHECGGQIDWQVVRRLWTGSLPVALLTVVMISSGNEIFKSDWLSNAIGVLVIVTGSGLVLAPWLLNRAKTKRIKEPVRFKEMQPFLTILSGGVLGFLVALTSVGAGALGSVMLIYLYPLRMTPHRLVATDLVHAVPLAVLAGSGYLFAGMVDWVMLMNLLCGSVPAIACSSLLAKKLNGRYIQLSLGVALVLTGLKTVL